jgi:type I restriction enzyme S subunit
MTALVTENLPLVSVALNGIAKLRELIQELAVRGKLVSQDGGDEVADLLLGRIASERALSAKPAKPVTSLPEAERRHGIPRGWSWTRLASQVIESGAGWSPSCEPRPQQGAEWGVLKVSAVSWAIYKPE